MHILILFAFLAGCARPEAPTGITQADVEGVWAGVFQNTALLGRSLSGDVDWLFDRRTFEIEFLNPPEGQATRISGDWKFAGGKLVLTLRSSFPIRDDVGTTDSLFVSILDNQMSLRTSRGSNILLRKIRSSADFFDGVQDRIIAENFFFPLKFYHTNHAFGDILFLLDQEKDAKEGRRSNAARLIFRKLPQWMHKLQWPVGDGGISEDVAGRICAENPLPPRQRLISVFLGEPRA